MARIKIELPAQLPFRTMLPLRITDLNYGGHVGNDRILSLMHEARVQYLHHLGLREVHEGTGLIMADAAIEFKKELFYGDRLEVSVGAGEFSRVGFELFYLFEKGNGETRQPAVLAKTAMVCYDYTNQKIMALPAELRQKLTP